MAQPSTLPPPRHPAVLWSRIKLRWPFLIWLVAAAAAAWLYYNGGYSGPLTGVLEAIREQVAPIEDARLLSVEVVQGQFVRKGDLLARMDTAILDAQLELERLQLERQFEREVRRLEGEIRAARLQQAEYEAELSVLDPEIARLRDLLARGFADAQSVASLRARREAIARALELFPETMAAYEEELADARRQRDAVARFFAGEIPAGQVDSPSAGLLALRRESYTFRATRDGVVSRIYHEPGNVVAAGDPIMTLIVKESQVIVCFLPESQAHDLRLGMKLEVMPPLGSAGPPVEATVTALGPEILGLPGRVSPVPGQTVRGRRVMLTPDAFIDLLPGEAVSVRLPPPAWRDVLTLGASRRRPLTAPAEGNR